MTTAHTTQASPDGEHRTQRREPFYESTLVDDHATAEQDENATHSDHQAA